VLYGIAEVPFAQSAALAMVLWATSLLASLPGALLLPRAALHKGF
jgi:hypothetical protein